MPTFLSDPVPALYLVLIAFVVATGAVAGRYQDRRSLIRFGVALAALLALYLIDKSVESPREEATRRVQAMAEAANARNRDAFVEHVADKVEFVGGAQPATRTKAEVRSAHFWDILQQFDVRVAVWDFSRENVKQTDPNTVEIGFMGKGETRGEGKQFPVYIRATFTRQADGQFRLTRFGTYHPTNHDEPLGVPGFP